MPTVVFIGAGAGPTGKISPEGSLALASAANVIDEATAPIGDASWLAHMTGDAIVHRLVADPLRRAQVEIDALLAKGVRVSLVPGIDARPLANRRVVVTRASEQAGELAEMLVATGAVPLLAPVLSFHSPPDPARLATAARDVASYDWVAFTSANGVERFFAELRRQGFDARAFGRARIAAIGPGTATALGKHAIVADCIASDHRGEGLAETLLARARRGERVLVPRALVARDVFPDSLRTAGLHVDVVPAYETRPPPDADVRALREGLAKGAIDAVTLTSSSAVTNLATLIGDDAPALLAKAVVASIGPITSSTAKRLGIRIDVNAVPHTLKDLVSALESHFMKRA